MRLLSAWLCLAKIVFVSGVFLGEVAQAAGLGDSVATVSSYAKVTASNDNLKISAKTSSLGATYSVRETTDDLRKLKEFVTGDGVIFAISWEGVGAPNFSEIFGKYYDDFKKERDSSLRQRKNRKALSLKTSDIVVNSFGQGAFMSGSAYVTSLFPPGLAPEDLK